MVKEVKEPATIFALHVWKTRSKSESQLIKDQHKKNAVYLTKQEAEDARYGVANYNGYSAEYVFVKEIPNNFDWAEEDREKFRTNEYVAPVWQRQDWVERPETQYHFPHISVEDPTLLAYTQTSFKGWRGIHTKIKPGKYLQTFYGDRLAKYDIQRWVELYNADLSFELKLATSAEEIREIYLHDTCAPESCMRYLFQNLPVHPSEIYAAGDLAVAYIERPFPEYEGIRMPVARAIVWPAQKKFGRVYGANALDMANLKGTLLKSGYTEVDRYGMKGAKLRRIEFKNDCKPALVMPYLDTYQAVQLHDDHLIIGKGPFEEKNFFAESSEGIIRLYIYYSCGHCQRRVREDYCTDIRIDADVNAPMQKWCSFCQDNYSGYCYGCNHYVPTKLRNKRVYHREGYSDYFCDFCVDNQAEQDQVNNYYYLKSMMVTLSDGRRVSKYSIPHGFERCTEYGCDKITPKGFCACEKSAVVDGGQRRQAELEREEALYHQLQFNVRHERDDLYQRERLRRYMEDRLRNRENYYYDWDRPAIRPGPPHRMQEYRPAQINYSEPPSNIDELLVNIEEVRGS